MSCEEDNSDIHAAGNRKKRNGIQINENCELTKSSILVISICLLFSFFNTTLLQKERKNVKNC